MGSSDTEPPEDEAVPDYGEAFVSVLRARRGLPAHSLPPAEHVVWWDRGLRDGVEIGMIYAQEALRMIAVALDGGDTLRAQGFTTIFETEVFATRKLSCRDDGRIEKTILILDEDFQYPPGGANPKLLDALAEAAAELLGKSGRMIAASRPDYVDAHPEHVIVFRADVRVQPGWKVWWGDVDLTLDEPKLLELARLLDRNVYVLPELDGRLEVRDENPLIDRATYAARPDGRTEIAPGVERDERKQLRLAAQASPRPAEPEP